MNNNDRFMDALSAVSFLIGVANYNENLSQSDKDDLMQSLDEKTNIMIECIKKELYRQNDMLEYQNAMLKHITEMLENGYDINTVRATNKKE